MVSQLKSFTFIAYIFLLTSAMLCPLPEDPRRVYSRTSRQYQSMVNVSCAHGFEMMLGSSIESTCMADQSWYPDICYGRCPDKKTGPSFPLCKRKDISYCLLSVCCTIRRSLDQVHVQSLYMADQNWNRPTIFPRLDALHVLDASAHFDAGWRGLNTF